MALGITTMLSIVAMSNNVFDDAPRTAYLKAIDIWILGCFSITFTTLLEYVVVIYIENFLEGDKPLFTKIQAKGTKKNVNRKALSQRIDSFFRLILPILFVLLVVIYAFWVGRHYWGVMSDVEDPGFKDEVVMPTIIENELYE